MVEVVVMGAAKGHARRASSYDCHSNRVWRQITGLHGAGISR
jgi:hypothetical protein